MFFYNPKSSLMISDHCLFKWVTIKKEGMNMSANGMNMMYLKVFSIVGIPFA